MNPATLDFDAERLKNSLNVKDRLLAVVCPHLFGLPADIPGWHSLLADPGIPVIEDAAQAMGGISRQEHLGTIGDIGFFSLGRGKAFSTVTGGIIVTRSDQISIAIKRSIRELAGNAATDRFKSMGYALALTIVTNPSLFWAPKSLPGLKLGDTIYDIGFPISHFSPFQAGLARNWQKRIAF